MPNYYNPNTMYPMTYGVQMAPAGVMPVMPPQQSQGMMQPQRKTMEWVEGEIGAKAFQMPPDIAPNQAIPLWDSTDTIIYIKSWNQMGMPNPLQVIHYKLPEQGVMLPQASGDSGASSEAPQYATRSEMAEVREAVGRIESMMRQGMSGNNQNSRNNGSQQNNRG